MYYNHFSEDSKAIDSNMFTLITRKTNDAIELFKLKILTCNIERSLIWVPLRNRAMNNTGNKLCFCIFLD